jgi:tetratricopeptide (TPR) repeat protein
MTERTDVKIFIASSGELNAEREESLQVIVEVNKLFPHLHLEPVLFELDTASGNNPGKVRIQDVINPLLDKSEVVVVLFYSKIGEFTKEEFDRAKSADKKIFLYLKDGFQPKRVVDSTNFTEVLKLKESIEQESEIRYKKFANTTDYNGTLYKDLTKYIESKYPSSKAPTSITASAVENKLSDYPEPSALFTGRKIELNDFKKFFESFRIIAIEGIGGTGKTQFLSKCIEDLIEDKKRIIWLDGSIQSNFDVFVESAGYGDVLKGKEKTDRALYSGFKDLIERDEKIIFWDNFNDYEDPTFSKFLSFAHQYFRKATVILITKTEPSIEGITSLPIIRLEGLNEDAVEYAKKLRASNIRYNSISDQDLSKICNAVEGHPLAIEFSMWLMGYGKSVEDIMLHMPEFSGIKKVEEFSKRLFLDIFNHPNTSNEERECFLKCSVFKERIKEEEIRFLNDGKDIFYLLAGLSDKLLMTFKEGYYEIHPLVRSFCYEKLHDKKGAHKKAADYFITQRSEKLNASLEEKIFYHLSEAQVWETIADHVEFIGKKFINLGQLGFIGDLINKLLKVNVNRPTFDIFLGDIFQIKAEWDKAIAHFQSASNCISDDVVKADGTIKYGEILFRQGNALESLPYFERAYEFSKQRTLRAEEARAINDIGLVYNLLDKLDIAFEKVKIGLKIRKEIGDFEGIATSYNNLAVIHKKKRQYAKAIEYHNQSIKICEEIGDKINLVTNFINIAYVFVRQENKLDEAIAKANSAMRIAEEIGDKESVCYCFNLLGQIFADQGKPDESFLKYKESLQVAEEIGDKNGVALALSSMGTLLLEDKNYSAALDSFFKSLHICRQIKNKSEEKNLLSWIQTLNNEVGKERFKELVKEVYSKLIPEIQDHLQPREFFNDPVIREGPKVGRNDPCTCGSGKKYKNCHGKIKL